MPRFFIVVTGSELLKGQVIDANGPYLLRRLAKLGHQVVGCTVVGDDRRLLKDAVRLAQSAADVVVTTGGLGPTFDDLTREAVYEAAGVEAQLAPAAMEAVKKAFSDRNMQMPDNNQKQALLPLSAATIHNRNGTAPGVLFEEKGKMYILLPGPPGELRPMWEDEVEPVLKIRYGPGPDLVKTRTIKVFGLSESATEERIRPLLDKAGDIKASIVASNGEVHVGLTLRGEEPVAMENKVMELADKIGAVLGDNVFGFDDDTLPGVVAKRLVSAGRSVATAESCTGGLLGKLITDQPGSSRFFWGGVVSYSNEAKTGMLGVEAGLIDSHGAVSEDVARAMAEGVRSLSGADYGIGVTGIAGPDGGSPEKPVGLVYTALAGPLGTRVRELRLMGDRETIRQRTALSCLDWLRRELEGMC